VEGERLWGVLVQAISSADEERNGGVALFGFEQKMWWWGGVLWFVCLFGFLWLLVCCVLFGWFRIGGVFIWRFVGGFVVVGVVGWVGFDFVGLKGLGFCFGFRFGLLWFFLYVVLVGLVGLKEVRVLGEGGDMFVVR